MKNEKSEEIWRSFKFLLFSISAGIIEIGSFSLLTELTQWSYWPCYLIALILSVLWNFTLNRRFTFRSANNVPLAMLKVFGYYLVFTPASTILGNYLAETLLWNGYLVTGINMILNLVTEYLFQRFVVFGKSLDTNSLAQDEIAGQGEPASED
jgi:putative flippase GtrA